MRKTLPLAALNIEAFREFLIRSGAKMLDATNEWEVLRFRGSAGTGIIYRNAKGKATICGDEAIAAFDRFSDGLQPIELTPAGPIFKPVSDHPEPEPHEFHLFVDASHVNAEKLGAWAGLLLAGKAIHQFSGPLKGEITCSTSAEIRGAANALHRAIALGHLPAGAIVIVHCDNLNVVQRLNRTTRRKAKPEIADAIIHIREIARGRQLRLSAAWVKGHQAASSGDWRAKFNQMCDDLARMERNKLQFERAL